MTTTEVHNDDISWNLFYLINTLETYFIKCKNAAVVHLEVSFDSLVFSDVLLFVESLLYAGQHHLLEVGVTKDPEIKRLRIERKIKRLRIVRNISIQLTRDSVGATCKNLDIFAQNLNIFWIQSVHSFWSRLKVID